ncbi:MAG: DUF3124 domain-containing protein [Acidobacteriota bacterium]
MKSLRSRSLVPGILLFAALLTFPGSAFSELKQVRGQTVYVPAYSHIYYGDRDMPFYLTVTLSIRNTDLEDPITVTDIKYIGSDGKLIKDYLDNDVRLDAQASMHSIVKESDKSGGAGAHFLVVWKAGQKVSEPILETIMIGTATQQGISFTSRGVAVKEDF